MNPGSVRCAQCGGVDFHDCSAGECLDCGSTKRRVETYVPRPRPAGEYRAKIAASIKEAAVSRRTAHLRHPSGNE